MFRQFIPFTSAEQKNLHSLFAISTKPVNPDKELGFSFSTITTDEAC